MGKFKTEDVADYYDQTLIHYKQWWNLEDSHSLHYGFWYPETKTFKESLINTNKRMAQEAEIKPNSLVLDAGCGVGGAAMFLAENYDCQVQGVTLSGKQVEFAQRSIQIKKLQNQVGISKQDYTKTKFTDNYFNYAWACESSSSAVKKEEFAKEMYRVLKPGGTLVLTDFFWPHKNVKDPNDWMKKWGDTWGISSFDDIQTFIKHLEGVGFEIKKNQNLTKEVTPSAKRMYKAYRLGALSSRIYNIINRKSVSRFAKTHFLCGKYQYKALQENLWNYHLLVVQKPNAEKKASNKNLTFDH